MPERKSSRLWTWTALTFGTTLIAVGVGLFEFLNHFTTGGVSGLSLILGYFFPAVGAAGFLPVFNFSLLLLGFVFLGRSFGLRTVYCSSLLSVEIFLLEKLLERTVPLTDEPMLETVFMILLPSLGCAILFWLDASSGGTDILAMIIKKYTGWKITFALFVSDFLIVSLLFFVYGWEAWLFSILAFLSRVLLMDYLLQRMNTAKYCTVITSPAYREAICAFILQDLGKSATVCDVFFGAYTQEKKSVLLVVLTHKQAIRLKTYAKTLDENIFIIVTSSSDVTGEGFYPSL